MRHASEQAVQSRLNDEAVPGKRHCGLEERGPGPLAELGMGPLQHVQQPRHPDGETAGDGVEEWKR